MDGDTRWVFGVDAAELLEPLRREPSRSAILSDVDGTLAPIVLDPARAAVPRETTEVLSRLASRYSLVAFITGRPALEARRMVGVDAAVYAGNHGLEVLEPGGEEPATSPALDDRAEAAREVIAAHEAGELRHEDKGPIQALHWRGARDPEGARALAEEIGADAEDRGLVTHWGRQVLELRPTASVDKGSAVTALVADRGIELAMFGGDDRTDLDAFDALGRMREDGRLSAVVRVGVTSEEAPPGLIERSDVQVEGPGGFLEVLRLLAGAG
jgi:trehalose 6-phosphate phosphatase